MLQSIQFKADDGFVVDGLYGKSSNPGQTAGILLLHEILGFDNVNIRTIAGHFVANGYNVLIPNLMQRSKLKFICILELMSQLKHGNGRVFSDIEAAQKWLSQRPEVNPEKIGVAGFCMGGGFAILHAAKQQVKVAANFYGEVPKSHSDLKGVCPVVGGFGARDMMFGKKGEVLQSHLTALDIEHDIKTYPKAGHAFMSERRVMVDKLFAFPPLRVGYDKIAADDSWERILKFFAKHLK